MDTKQNNINDNTLPKKCLLPYSGGLDSTVILWQLFNSGLYDEIHCISFDYGQRHKVELDCAKWNIEYLNTKSNKTKVIWKEIDIKFMRDIASTSCLTNDDIKVPGKDDNSIKPTSYVPNRNMIMLSIAAAYAESHHILEIYHGANGDDYGGYWDCRQAFFNGLNTIFSDNPGCQIKFYTPLLNKTKAEIIKNGLDEHVKFEHTWSDYSGGSMYFDYTKGLIYKADANSANSQLRINAFAELGKIDPLPYQQDLTEFWKSKNCSKI